MNWSVPMTAYRYPMILLLLVLGSMPLGNGRFGYIARAAAETPKDMLAAQIRTQGFVCDKPQGAKRNVKQSRPDHDVWVLRCSNATYRISRYPDLAAKVEQLR
jgi:hypothetical protein